MSTLKKEHNYDVQLALIYLCKQKTKKKHIKIALDKSICQMSTCVILTPSGVPSPQRKRFQLPMPLKKLICRSIYYV